MRKNLILIIVLVALASSATEASADTFDLKAFGAVGDGQTDDGPALQRALDALAQAGGGTVFVPQGRYAIITPVYKDFSGLASSVTILGVESSTPIDNTGEGSVLAQGLDLVSEFAPMTGETGVAISVSGLQHFLIKDIGFIGTPDVLTDAQITLAIDQVEDATIRHCEFYGLISQQPGGAIVLANRSRLNIESSKFLGSSGNSAVNIPVVQNLRWKGITVTDSTFLDYGTRPELYGKTGMGTPLSWINIGNAEAFSSDSPRREVIVSNVFLDEGALAGILATPHYYQPESAPIDLVYITGLRMNVANVHDWAGNLLLYPKAVFIEKSRYQWSQYADAAINLNIVGTAILDELECVDGANRIRADAATETVSVINSVYTYLDSDAQTTDVINTESSSDDPVQFVRGQFEEVLNRAPDPAGHFYWSDRLLRCRSDAGCVTATRADLDSYLSAAPSPKFSISGRATDEDGEALADLTVSLTGAQTVAAQTDADGRYGFSDLPTSGVYAVSTSKDHFTFIEPSVSFITPSGDQTADFTGVLNKYSIAGQIVDVNSNGILGISVALTGGMSATVMTDGNGHFMFEDLPALESYSVTPTLKNHTFQPSSWTIDELTNDHSADIVGIRDTHTIQGRVTKTDGAGLSGALVTLSGSQGASATTNSNGDYSFSELGAGGNYTVTLTKTHYAFQPPSQTFNDLSLDKSAAFVATLLSHTISGRVTRTDGSGIAAVNVTLSGSSSGVTITDSGGNYSIANCAAGGNYTISVARVNYSFGPQNNSVNDLGGDYAANFTGEPVSYQISGHVTLNGTALPGVTLTVTGSQSAAITAGADGLYSIMVPAEGNYTVTPSSAKYTFNPANAVISNLNGNSVGDFAATLKPGVPVLISEENSTRALAFDSVLQTREPFALTYFYPWTSDRRTRVMLFAMNFELAANENAAAVTADGEDVAHRIYPLTVEYVGKAPGWNWLNCIVVRLDDNLGDVGDILVQVTYHGVSSNRVRLGIGHVGGGPSDDAGAVATPGRAP